MREFIISCFVRKLQIKKYLLERIDQKEHYPIVLSSDSISVDTQLLLCCGDGNSYSLS